MYKARRWLYQCAYPILELWQDSGLRQGLKGNSAALRKDVAYLIGCAPRALSVYTHEIVIVIDPSVLRVPMRPLADTRANPVVNLRGPLKRTVKLSGGL